LAAGVNGYQSITLFKPEGLKVTGTDQVRRPHRYEYEIARGSAPERVVRLVGTGKRTLELGSGPGTITKALTDNDCRVTALEIDPSAIELVRPFCNSVHLCDFNDPQWPSKLPSIGRFDVIVAADVFEHLLDPWSCLKLAREYLNKGGCMVVSLPHAGYAGITACLLNSDFEYGSWGVLDSTHIRFFGLINIQQLFEGAGLKIAEAEFVVIRPEDSELAHQWKRLSKETQQVLASNKYSCVYQVVLRAVPANADEPTLSLLSQPIPVPIQYSSLHRIRRNSILRSLGNMIPPSTRKRIKRYLKLRAKW